MDLSLFDLINEGRQVHAVGLAQFLAPLFFLSHFTDSPGYTIIFHHNKGITNLRHTGKTQYLNGYGWGCLTDIFTHIVEHGPDPACLESAHKGVTHPKRSGLHKHGGHWTSPPVQFGFDDGPRGAAIAIGS